MPSVVAILVVLGLFGAWVHTVTRRPHDPSRAPLDETAGPRRPIRLALARQFPSSLAALAVDGGFCERARLDMTVTDHASGKLALATLLSGDADVATTAETPVVFASIAQEDFRILAVIASTDNEYRIVARRDRGIALPSDLRGRRIGTQGGSASHFFLDSFLLKHALSVRDVVTVFMAVEDLPTALDSGEIDAFSMREPYVSQAHGMLGDRFIEFLEPGLHRRFELLVARTAWLAEHPEAAVALLRAMHAALEFARTEREAALRLASRRLAMAPSEVRALWLSMRLRLSLDQSLFLCLEGQARWAIESGLVAATQVPNYLHYVDIAPLKEACPEALPLVH